MGASTIDRRVRSVLAGTAVRPALCHKSIITRAPHIARPAIRPGRSYCGHASGAHRRPVASRAFTLICIARVTQVGIRALG